MNFWHPQLLVATLIFSLGTVSVLASLPPGWTDIDIGAPGQSGSASITNGGWTVSGGGADIWGTADQFNLASEAWVGDGTIVALVTSQQNTDPSAKAGLMFRNDTTPGSIFADLVVIPANGVSLQWRATTGGPCNYQATGGVVPPVWLKLAVSAGVVRGYYSIDSVNWTQVGTDQPLGIDSAALVGLAVTAHNNSLLSTATF